MAGINPFGAPLDYAGAMGQASNPAESLLSGLKVGAAIGELAGKGAEAKAAAQYQTDLEETLKLGSPSAFAALAAKYPASATGIKSAWGTLDEGRKDQEVTLGTQAYLALSRGQPEIARGILDDQIAAAENSGQPSSRLRTMRDALDSSPEQVKTSLALALSTIDPQRWSKTTVFELEKAQSDSKSAASTASKAAVEAAWAESNAAQDAVKRGFDIQKLQQDIALSGINQKIALAQERRAQAKSIDDQSKADLELKKLRLEIDGKTREVVNEATEAAGASDIVLNAISETLPMMVKTDANGNVILDKNKKPMFKSSFESATGPQTAALPEWLVDQDTANIQEQFKSLTNQLSFANMGKLKGLLTDSDFKALGAALGNLSLRQDPALLYNRIQTIDTLVKKAKVASQKRYGTPSVMPTPQVPGTEQAPGAQQGEPTEAQIQNAVNQNLNRQGQ
jgi:hypothetical protein